MFHIGNLGDVASAALARKRPVFHPDLGRFFSDLRAARKWSLRGAASLAKRRGLYALTYQVLYRLESGQTKSPTPEVLRAFAVLHELSYEELVRRLTIARYGVDLQTTRDLPRHGGTGQQRPHEEGEADVPAASRVRELQNRVEQLEAYEAIVRQIRPHLASLITLVGLEGDDAAQKKTRRRRRD